MAVEIADWNDLDNVRNDLTGDYVLVNDLNENTDGYAGIGDSFAPIGYRDNIFTGSFDGGGYSITDIEIVRSAAEDGVALFGWVENATIENIHISGVLNTTDEDFQYYGGLVGITNPGTVTNCSSSVDVTTNGGYSGGLVARHNGGTVTDSYATGSVEGDDRVGGLVGLNRDTITDSYAVGLVTGNTLVGGLVGDDDLGLGTTEDSYWDTEATGQDTSAGGTALTTFEMQGSEAETNMDGFDFADVWDAVLESDSDTTADGYPILLALDRESQLEAQEIEDSVDPPEPPQNLTAELL